MKLFIGNFCIHYVETKIAVYDITVHGQNAGGHNAGGQNAGENCMVGQNAGLFWAG